MDKAEREEAGWSAGGEETNTEINSCVDRWAMDFISFGQRTEQLHTPEAEENANVEHSLIPVLPFIYYTSTYSSMYSVSRGETKSLTPLGSSAFDFFHNWVLL